MTHRPVPRDDPWYWYYRLFVYWVGIDFALIGLGLWFGPDRWHTARSLKQLREYVLPFWHVPWPVWGALFLLTALLITASRTRVAGYVMGAMLCWLFIGFSVVYSLVVPGAVNAPPMTGIGTTNIITIGLSALAPLAMLAGIRFSVVLQKRRSAVNL